MILRTNSTTNPIENSIFVIVKTSIHICGRKFWITKYAWQNFVSKSKVKRDKNVMKWSYLSRLATANKMLNI